MLIILSSSKTLDFSFEKKIENYSIPNFIEESKSIIDKLKILQINELSKLLAVNYHLALLNYQRIAAWHLPFTPENAKPAIFVYQGDVYKGLNALNFTNDELSFAHHHIRILSGLYGILKPLDLIQPYRLEMNTTLQFLNTKTLSQFWKDKITSAIEKQIFENKIQYIINLASNEYSSAINFSQLNIKIITPVFYEMRNGQLKSIIKFLKYARGLMAAYIVKNKITNPADLKAFNSEGYTYLPNYSDQTKWVFAR